MPEHEPEYLFFPIVNEHGFKVDDYNYWHMINTIIDAQVELKVVYPEDIILVYYELQP